MLGDEWDFDLLAPNRPPPALTLDQLHDIAHHGFVDLQLPAYLSQELNELFLKAAVFFELPQETKACLFPSVPGDSEQGYSYLPGEKEFVTMRYRSTSQKSTTSTIGASDEEGRVSTELELLVGDAWHDIANLMYRILMDIGESIGSVSPGAWDGLVAESLEFPRSQSQATPTLFRIFRYFPERGAADMHRDLGLLTLCVCRERGLQVWERLGAPAGEREAPEQPDSVISPPVHGGSPECIKTGSSDTSGASAPRRPAQPGKWRDTGEVTVLVGDTLRVLSGNRIPAGMHRVVTTDRGRCSIVFALRPSISTTIELRHFGGGGAVESKALWDRIRKNRVNVNAQREIRKDQLAKRRTNDDIA